MTKRAQTIKFDILEGNKQVTLHWQMDADGNHRLLLPAEEKEGNWANYESPATLAGYIIVTAHWKDTAVFHSKPFHAIIPPIQHAERIA